MSRMDVGQAFGPAYNRTIAVLFRPFQFRKWLALGFVSLLSSGGGFSLNLPSPGQEPGNSGPQDYWTAWLAHHIPLIAALTIAFFVLAILLAWVCSVLRFVYMDQITRNSGAIREPFARLKKLGTSYFLWQLVCALVALLVIGALVMLIMWSFVMVPTSPVAAKILAVVAAAAIGLPFIFLAILAAWLADEFVTAAMYARGIKVVQAWGVVLHVLGMNVGQTVLYLLLLMAIGLGIAMASLFAVLLTGLVVAIPAGLVALIGYFIWQAVHLTWTPVVIGVTATVGAVFLAVWIYATQCVIQPLAVFRRSFTLVVLGQTDPSLVTIPITATPQAPIEARQEE
jgi:hypothetical protein